MYILNKIMIVIGKYQRKITMFYDTKFKCNKNIMNLYKLGNYYILNMQYNISNKLNKRVLKYKLTSYICTLLEDLYITCKAYFI